MAVHRLGTLGADKQIELGRNVMQAAEGNAWDAMTFLRSLGEGGQTWPMDFVFGVLVEPLANEGREIRFKTRQLKPALASLRSAPPEDRVELCGRVVDEIRGGELQVGAESDLDEVISAVQELATEEDLADLVQLAESLKDLPRIS